MTSDTRPAARTVVYAKDVGRVATFYQRTLALSVVDSDSDFMLLGHGAIEIAVVRISNAIAASIHVATPPALREDTPVKGSFLVDDFERVRAAAVESGGGTRPIASVWRWRGQRHLDGHDPEGNVVQFRQCDDDVG